MKLKELLSGLSSITLTDAEAIGVMSLLQERSPSALEAWYKVRRGVIDRRDKQEETQPGQSRVYNVALFFTSPQPDPTLLLCSGRDFCQRCRKRPPSLKTK